VLEHSVAYSWCEDIVRHLSCRHVLAMLGDADYWAVDSDPASDIGVEDSQGSALQGSRERPTMTEFIDRLGHTIYLGEGRPQGVRHGMC